MVNNINIDHKSSILKLLIILFLIVATYSVFSQVLNYGFINLDDDIYVTENKHVQDGLTLKGIFWAFAAKNDAGFWIPFTWLSLMLDSSLYGLNAGGYHLTNLFLHIINAILLFLIFERLTGALWQSAFVAALFALHPLKVESVAWITERKDVLSAMFFILTIWAYTRYVEHQEIKRYLLIFLLFFLGLMAKPMLVTLPFVMLLLDYWPFARFQLRECPCNSGLLYQGNNPVRLMKQNTLYLLFEKLPFFLLAVGMSVLAFLTQKSGGALASFELRPLESRIANALLSYVKYIGKMFWPRQLAVFYPHQTMYSTWHIIGAIFILLFVTVLVIRKFHKPYLLVGWFWYLGTLVPVIGLIQAGPQAMADRFTYIPLIGLFIIIAWGIPDILNGWHYKKAILSISSICVLSFLMITTCLQVRYWKNSITLFEHSLTVTTNNWLMHNNLGHSFILDGKIDDAILHFKEALKIKPNYSQAQYNLGLALTYQGKMEESIIHYKKALKIKPDYEEAHTDLGSVLAQQGKTKEAVFHFREALSINPYFVRAKFNFGVALAEQGNFREAISHFKEALRIRPDYVKAHFPLGLSYVEIGDYRSALEEYKILKTINPDLSEILFNKIYENKV